MNNYETIRTEKIAVLPTRWGRIGVSHTLRISVLREHRRGNTILQKVEGVRKS